MTLNFLNISKLSLYLLEFVWKAKLISDTETVFQTFGIPSLYQKSFLKLSIWVFGNPGNSLKNRVLILLYISFSQSSTKLIYSSSVILYDLDCMGSQAYINLAAEFLTRNEIKNLKKVA